MNTHQNLKHDPQITYLTKRTVSVGICVMKKKLQYKKYKQPFELLKCQQIQLVQLWPYFGQHWSVWPVVDVLLQFHSKGLPYVMIKEYAQTHKPFMINDLQNQQLLWDRTAIYDVLRQISIPIPNHVRIFKNQQYLDKLQEQCFGNIYTNNGQQLSYEEYKQKTQNRPNALRKLKNIQKEEVMKYEIIQQKDIITFKSNNQQIQLKKPIMQKSFESRDHGVAVYYQEKLGSGRRILYRQNYGATSCVQSKYQKQQSFIRKDQNYIYEQFLPTNAYEIKAYIFGQFIFAESRRAPIVDVQKTAQNIQERYCVSLTEQQKMYCNKIIKKFGQQICGLDILRSDGKSYICDVNGWEFASASYLGKQIENYWKICSVLLKDRIFKRFFPNIIAKIEDKTYQDYLLTFNKYQSLISTQINPQKQQLRTIISFFNFQKDEKSQEHILTNSEYQIAQKKIFNIGQIFRAQRYGSSNSLDLYSKFKHNLQISISENICIIDAGHFLRGFLDVNNELSPALISMIKVNNKNCVQILQNLMNKVSCKIQGQSMVELDSYLFFRQQEFMRNLLNIFREIGKRRKQINLLQKMKYLSHIQLRFYVAEKSSSNQKQYHSLVNEYSRIQLSIFPKFQQNLMQKNKQTKYQFSITLQQINNLISNEKQAIQVAQMQQLERRVIIQE